MILFCNLRYQHNCYLNKIVDFKSLFFFIFQILTNAGPCGMSITSEAVKPFPTIGNTQNDIRKYFETAKSHQYDIIFVVVPNAGPQYSYVKKASELFVGCLTQCVKMRTLGKMNPQTVCNILLKVRESLT